MIVSGIRNNSIVAQDFSQISAILSQYYPVVESEAEAVGDVLIETMPDQVIRQRFNGVSFYYGVEPPINPPFTFILKYNKLPLKPLQHLSGLKGKKKCYLSRVDDEPYIKDGDVYLFARKTDMFYAEEIRAYVKRWGHKVYMYFDQLPQSFEECGEIVPTNPYAENIVNIISNNLENYVDINKFEKEIFSFLSIII